MNILSIQSRVAYGHVGNSVAVFALQRMGHEVWPVDTVRFSNHPGHGAYRGRATAPGDVAEMIAGLDDLGILETCDAVLSGYLGDAATGPVILDAVARIKAANPRALYLCDPVMGDREGGLYVREDVVAFLKGAAIPAADIVTPNVFELETLTGAAVTDLSSAADAASALRGGGPETVIVTGIAADGPADEIICLGDNGRAPAVVQTPRLATDGRPDGAGDLFAAVFLGRFLGTRDMGEALSHAASAVFAVLGETLAAGRRELSIVAAQDELVAPSRMFPAVIR